MDRYSLSLHQCHGRAAVRIKGENAADKNFPSEAKRAHGPTVSTRHNQRHAQRVYLSMVVQYERYRCEFAFLELNGMQLHLSDEGPLIYLLKSLTVP